jgi:caffeoyl-CoA O-methyltransferase
MTAYDPDLEKYILDHIDKEDEMLLELNRLTHLKMVHPRMVSGHLQGKILRMFSMMIRPERILEIGTFTGYSAICLAQGMPETGHLQTIEINDEITDIPLKYFEKFNLSNKITLHVGDAKEIIPKLSGLFDLVFMDGEKSEYVEYYQLFFDKVKTGGFIIADNVLWNGKVLQHEASNDHFTKGIKRFNDLIRKDVRIEKVILPIRDGLMLLRKK